jgi:hypothetical protein
METKHPLKSAFTPIVDPQKLALLSRFFQVTLSIKDATCTDLIEELSALKADGCDDFDRILELYEYLQNMADPSFGELRLVKSPLLVRSSFCEYLLTFCKSFI